MLTFSNRFYFLLAISFVPLSLSWNFPFLKNAVLIYDLILFFLAFADYLVSKQDKSKFHVKRLIDKRFAIGEENQVKLHIENSSSKTITLKVKDEYPPEMLLKSRIEANLRIKPESYAQFIYLLTPLKRGSYQFGKTAIRFSSRLGLVWCQTTFGQEQYVKVYPSIRRAKEIEIKAFGNTSFLATKRKALKHGEGREFESLREYVYGDEFRHVSWTATARRSKLITKQYQIERNQNVIIALDAGRLMTGRIEGETKFEVALHSSLALMLATTRVGDNVGLVAFGRKIKVFIPPDKGYLHIDTVVKSLHDIEPEMIEPSYSRAFRFIASNIKKRSLIVVLTDLIDKESSQRLLKSLKLLRPRHLPLIVTISDRDLYELVSKIPENTKDLFYQSAAEEIIYQREIALRMIESIGGLAIDVTTSNLAPKLLEAYLKIKEKGLI
ncbi:MAG: DUF58 domain-containing protein [Pyrinomonadaceae bacterium]|nr:DUF58 domain-containing protein [Pyrinomonadaceae bacterium]MCX7639482.1 DUF58 domain-containing protein [Pyrinomonadaceae bacterium]MDW8304467.1 DUF58 domain-containing protein [Acidobacteriota bacterium]